MEISGIAGKIVLVTGGSRGIGRGIVLRFAEAGAGVALTYTSSRKEAEGAVQCYSRSSTGRTYLAPPRRDSLAVDPKEYGEVRILLPGEA